MEMLSNIILNILLTAIGFGLLTASFMLIAGSVYVWYKTIKYILAWIKEKKEEY